jgi:hypothetical protein
MKRTLLLLPALLVGCFGGLDADFAAGSRVAYDEISPKYRRYVEEDGSLDASLKKARLAPLAEWEKLIVEAEKALED